MNVCVPLNQPSQIPVRVPDNNVFIKPDQSSQPLVNIDARLVLFNISGAPRDLYLESREMVSFQSMLKSAIYHCR